MTLSTHRHVTRISLMSTEKFPSLCVEVEAPEVIQTHVVIVPATEHIHELIVGDGRVASPGAGEIIICVGDHTPLTRFEVKLVYAIDSIASKEATENHHGVSVHDCCVLIACWRFIHILPICWLGPNNFPQICSGVKCKKSIICVEATSSTKQVHFLVIYD